MFCEKCGAIVNENEKFCQKCGAEVQRSEEKGIPISPLIDSGNDNKLKINKKRMAIAASVIVLILFVFNIFFGSSSKEIRSVKNGNLEYYSEVTLEEAFKNWFSSPKWSYDSKTRRVEFSGKCTFADKPVKVTIGYRLYDNGVFETDFITMDDTYNTTYLSELEWLYLYATIFEDAYKEKGLDPPANLGSTMDLYDYFFN